MEPKAEHIQEVQYQCHITVEPPREYDLQILFLNDVRFAIVHYGFLPPRLQLQLDLIELPHPEVSPSVSDEPLALPRQSLRNRSRLVTTSRFETDLKDSAPRLSRCQEYQKTDGANPR